MAEAECRLAAVGDKITDRPTSVPVWASPFVRKILNLLGKFNAALATSQTADGTYEDASIQKMVPAVSFYPNE
jgi:hypothetical protein